MKLKESILEHCILLLQSKEFILDQATNSETRELLENYVFEIRMPYLANENVSYIFDEDYDYVLGLETVSKSVREEFHELLSSFNTENLLWED